MPYKKWEVMSGQIYMNLFDWRFMSFSRISYFHDVGMVISWENTGQCLMEAHDHSLVVARYFHVQQERKPA